MAALVTAVLCSGGDPLVESTEARLDPMVGTMRKFWDRIRAPTPSCSHRLVVAGNKGVGVRPWWLGGQQPSVVVATDLRRIPGPGQTQDLGLGPWALSPCIERVLSFVWPVAYWAPGSAC